VFVFVGIIVVMVQGYFIGKWSRRFGERKLIFGGLALLTLGLALTALTPAQPAPWYNHAQVQGELTAKAQTGQATATETTPIPLPADGNDGWAGLGWLLVAMIPISIGGGLLQPSINSLLTRRVAANERGSTLGVSAAFNSAGNALAPLMGGALFQIAAGLPLGIWAGLMGFLLIAAWMRLKPGTEETSVGVRNAQQSPA
jgi:MFS family permease